MTHHRGLHASAKVRCYANWTDDGHGRPVLAVLDCWANFASRPTAAGRDRPLFGSSDITAVALRDRGKWRSALTTRSTSNCTGGRRARTSTAWHRQHNFAGTQHSFSCKARGPLWRSPCFTAWNRILIRIVPNATDWESPSVTLKRPFQLFVPRRLDITYDNFNVIVS